MDGLEVLCIIARMIIYLVVPSIKIASVNFKTCGYGLVDSQVQCGDGIATCDSRGIGMRQDSVGVGGKGETKTVIDFSCTNLIFNIYANHRINEDVLHQCGVIALISHSPCSEDSVLHCDIGVSDGQTISNQTVVR